MTMTTNTTDENGTEQDGPLPTLAANMRRGSERLWKQSTNPMDRRPRWTNDQVVVEIPNQHGCVLVVSRSPPRARGVAWTTVLQLQRCGPDGARASLGAPIFITPSMLPTFCAAMASALEADIDTFGGHGYSKTPKAADAADSAGPR